MSAKLSSVLENICALSLPGFVMIRNSVCWVALSGSYCHGLSGEFYYCVIRDFVYAFFLLRSSLVGWVPDVDFPLSFVNTLINRRWHPVYKY